jgi:ATP-dependent RNA helicase RhlE
VSLVAAEEHELLRAIERLIGNPLPKQEVPGFERTIHSAPPLDLSGGRGRGGGGGGRRGGGNGGGGGGGAAGRGRAPAARSRQR